MLPNPTLDQLQVFLAVADTGSFSAAARQLNRAQSVVSYTIANLEAQLQLVLFDRQNRAPILTDSGRAILEDARRMMADLDGLRARSKALTEGLEGELKLAVSVMVPDSLLIAVLARFQKQFPTILLRLTVGAPFLVNSMVEQGGADIGIGGSSWEARPGIETRRVGLSFMSPVAAPDHPLAKLDRTIYETDLRDEVQIVVADTTKPAEGKSYNVLSQRTWRVSDMGTKRQLMLAGLGWGGMPFSLVHQDLMEGRLVRLDVEPYDAADYPVVAEWQTAKPPGPAGRWIVSEIAGSLGKCPGSIDEALASVDQSGRVGDPRSSQDQPPSLLPSAQAGE